VSEIPAGTRQSTLVMILESHRHTGIADVRVEALMFLTEDRSRALVTLGNADGIFTASVCLFTFFYMLHL